MAIRITRIDDIDGSEGAEAIAFHLDKTAYEIDLCVRNRLRFFRAIEPFVERARLVDDNEQESTVTTIVRKASTHDVPSSGIAPYDEPGTDEAAGEGLDLIDMARRMQS